MGERIYRFHWHQLHSSFLQFIFLSSWSFSTPFPHSHQVPPHHYPPQRRLLTLKFYICRCPDRRPRTSILLCLGEHVQTLKFFTFAEEVYSRFLALLGARIGSNFANIFVGYFEVKIFSRFPGSPTKLYGCNIADCVGATSLSRQQLSNFLAFITNFHFLLQSRLPFLIPHSLSTIRPIHLSLPPFSNPATTHYYLTPST